MALVEKRDVMLPGMDGVARIQGMRCFLQTAR